MLVKTPWRRSREDILDADGKMICHVYCDHRSLEENDFHADLIVRAVNADSRWPILVEVATEAKAMLRLKKEFAAIMSTEDLEAKRHLIDAYSNAQMRLTAAIRRAESA